VKDAAHLYIARGWAVFPRQHRGKRPVPDKGFKAAVTDAEGAERLWANRIGLNIGIATGKVSGFFVVDINGPEEEGSLAALEAQHGALPQTLTSTTGKGRRPAHVRDRSAWITPAEIVADLAGEGRGHLARIEGELGAAGLPERGRVRPRCSRGLPHCPHPKASARCWGYRLTDITALASTETLSRRNIAG
jgi:hypothetical protein